MNKSNAKVTKRTEKSSKTNHFEREDSFKIRSPTTKKLFKNASKIDKSAKSSPKKLGRSTINLTGYDLETSKILSRRNFKIKIKDGSTKNTTGNATDYEI
jgi:hypothetical protein